MPHKQVALEVAAFLDSPQARALEEIRDHDVRRIAEALLEASYDELGKAPRLLDGEDLRVLLGQLLPGHLARKDPLAEHVPAVLAAYLDHLEATQVVTQSFEIRQALEGATSAFRATVDSGAQAGRRAPAAQDPFVHRAAKLGRNDPCSCGSGKKYKKCHGRDA